MYRFFSYIQHQDPLLVQIATATSASGTTAVGGSKPGHLTLSAAYGKNEWISNSIIYSYMIHAE